MLAAVCAAVILHQSIVLLAVLELRTAPTGSSCALLCMVATAYGAVRTHCVRREDNVPSANMELFALGILTAVNALAASHVASCSATLAYVILVTLLMSLLTYGNYCMAMCLGLGAPATADVCRIHLAGWALTCLLFLNMPNFEWGLPACGVAGAMLLSTYLCAATNDVRADAIARGGRFRSWRQGAGHAAVMWMRPIERLLA